MSQSFLIASSPLSAYSGTVCAIFGLFILRINSSTSSGRIGAPLNEATANTVQKTALQNRLLRLMAALHVEPKRESARWAGYWIGGARAGMVEANGNA